MWMRRPLRASQCASSPSPSEDTIPMPVIQASFGSVMRHRLQWKAELVGQRVHVHPEVGIREGDMAEGQLRAALQLGANVDLRRGDRKTRAFMFDLCVDRQQLSRADETPHLGLLHHRQEWHALEL